MTDRSATVGPSGSSDPIVADVVSRLVDLYQPERIYLFGSAARGDAGPDSDYDFMVVVPDGTPPEVIRTKRVYRVLRGIDAPVDVLVCTRHDFDKQLHLKASFPSTIAREGRLLYGG